MWGWFLELNLKDARKDPRYHQWKMSLNVLSFGLRPGICDNWPSQMLSLNSKLRLVYRRVRRMYPAQPEQKRPPRDCPGGSVVKTPCFHCRGNFIKHLKFNTTKTQFPSCPPRSVPCSTAHLWHPHPISCTSPKPQSHLWLLSFSKRSYSCFL